MDTQERLHRVISKTNDAQDAVEGAVLRNWVVVADWVGVDGQKWLTHTSSENASAWESVGLLQTALDSYRNVVARDDDDG